MHTVKTEVCCATVGEFVTMHILARGGESARASSHVL